VCSGFCVVTLRSRAAPGSPCSNFRCVPRGRRVSSRFHFPTFEPHVVTRAWLPTAAQATRPRGWPCCAPAVHLCELDLSSCLVGLAAVDVDVPQPRPFARCACALSAPTRRRTHHIESQKESPPPLVGVGGPRQTNWVLHCTLNDSLTRAARLPQDGSRYSRTA